MADVKSLVPCRRAGGTEVLTPANELLPGDLIRLQDHGIVPCDLLLLQGSYLMDESLMSGESSPILKVNTDAINLNSLGLFLIVLLTLRAAWYSRG